jgi:hypothetical protein
MRLLLEQGRYFGYIPISHDCKDPHWPFALIAIVAQERLSNGTKYDGKPAL